jgi:hypothetical protein
MPLAHNIAFRRTGVDAGVKSTSVANLPVDGDVDFPIDLKLIQC